MANNPIYLPRLNAKIELFKRGDFDFITTIGDKKHYKQEQALKILTDDQHTEFLYGGAAGGAKSWAGSSWLAFMCLAYPWTKWFIGREELKRLRESTLITFFKVCSRYGLRINMDFKYNGQDHYIDFANGSRVDLLDLRYLPSDPMYDRYGSIEYTGGWMEEASESHHIGAYDTLKSRIGRHLNDQYGLLRKLFITSIPKKNWLYTTFYKPSVSGSLPDHQIYLQSLVQDNPFIETGYIEALESTSDKIKKERLLKGNWEYVDNPNALCSYDSILEIFNNKLADRSGNRYLTADIARFGSDKARIAVWQGYSIIDTVSYDISKLTVIQSMITYLQKKYSIPNSRCIADEDGMGGGVVDNCDIIGFQNGSSPLNEENYQNLQAQCGYKLAEMINAGFIGFDAEVSEDEKENIIIELEQLQTWKGDSDGKLRLKPKEEIKKDIGHSPDWRDVMLMRMYFALNSETPAELMKSIISHLH